MACFHCLFYMLNLRINIDIVKEVAAAFGLYLKYKAYFDKVSHNLAVVDIS